MKLRLFFAENIAVLAKENSRKKAVKYATKNYCDTLHSLMIVNVNPFKFYVAIIC